MSAKTAEKAPATAAAPEVDNTIANSEVVAKYKDAAAITNSKYHDQSFSPCFYNPLVLTTRNLGLFLLLLSYNRGPC
jgi:hypothetical protein